jgi:peptidoglycan-associated lipoprotein
MQSHYKKILSIVIGILLLAGCSSMHSGQQANIQGTAAMMQTQGLGAADDLSALQSLQNDPGPHYGVLVNRSFYFAFDRYDVNPKDYPIIKAHAVYLLQHPQKRVVIEGNTDLRGSREYNIALGQRRANAVKSILRMQGVPNKQIRTVSYGAEKPIAFGHTEAAYRLNRRDDLRYEN